MADPEREYRLIQQLELRIASAQTGEKFETIIQKFLAALVLKLASDDAKNRNLTIKVCQYINQRLKIDTSIQVPIQALSKPFREAQNAFVKQFCLLFIQQGLARLPQDSGIQVLPEMLRSIKTGGTPDRSDERMSVIAFDFLLGVLRTWTPPEHRSAEDEVLKETFGLSSAQSDYLAARLNEFLLFDPKSSSPSTTAEDIKATFARHFSSRTEVVPSIARFLFTTVFTDTQRFVPAVTLSVDANARASSIADVMFKQCDFDLEAEDNIDSLFKLYDSGKPRLQTRVLTLLSRSQASTDRTSKILQVVESQLNTAATGLEASKLRAAMFTYLLWAVRVGKAMSTVGTRLIESLKEFIELQGWPNVTAAAAGDLEIRAKAYESIGLLATTLGDNGPSIQLVTWLFASLRCDTARDMKGSVEEALSRIINVVSVSNNDELERLKSLLLWNVMADEGDEDPSYFLATRNSAKYPAVRFANKCLSFGDDDARFIDLMAIGSERREIVEEGHRGLDPYWHRSNLKISGIHNVQTDPTFPSFSDFIDRVFGSDPSRTGKELAVLQKPSVLSATVIFGRNLLSTEAWRGSPHAVEEDPDWSQKIDGLLENDPDARSLFRKRFAETEPRACSLFLKASVQGMALGLHNCARTSLLAVSLCSNDILRDLGPGLRDLCGSAAVQDGIQRQAARVYGVLTSLSRDYEAVVLDELVKCEEWSSAVGQKVNLVTASLLKATSTLACVLLRERGQETPATLLDKLSLLLSEIVRNTKDKNIKNAAYTAVGQLSLSLRPNTSTAFAIPELLEDMFTQGKRENETAVAALGRLLNFYFSCSVTEGETRDQIFDKLIGLHEVRKAEYHFALGEAMAVAALGYTSQSTIADYDIDGPAPDWGLHGDVFEVLLKRAIESCAATKPALKKAAAIWLLSLVQYCSRSDLLRTHLRDCQAAFSRLLNDRDEIVQETGSRGLGLVYEKGDKGLRDDLVRDLVQSFTGSSAKMSGTVAQDTQLFEPGALPTEGGQSVTTYKDIVSLAQEMGDPSLVYRFMNMASNNAIWSSRAAFGRFGLSGVLANSDYLRNNQKFYPKLFRYRFDPNPNVQRSMEDIWKALVADPHAVIDENFDLIMQDLLRSVLLGKEWRAREASCAAIAELVQGRELEKFEKYLDEIWQVAFKVLDDVKETVRVAAMKLCHTLTAMLTRNLEVGEGNTKRATTMMNHAMPFLLQQMEGGSAKEVQQYAIVTLLDIVKKSPPRSLRSFAPIVLETLVNALSSLEHESVNYLHLNADKYGLTTEKLDKMRVSSINASPVTEAIERCLESLAATPASSAPGTAGRAAEAEAEAGAMEGVQMQIPTSPVEDAMRRLEGTFKSAIGLPSRVGLSRVMITLVLRHPTMFRPHVDRFVRLTRKCILDRNATVSVSFSMALAYLLRLASEKEVRQTSRHAQKLYFESQELSHRSVAGEVIHAISKASNDVVANYASMFLPFAFVGQHDLDADVRDRFHATWTENVGGPRALKLYLDEIVELTGQHITSGLWPIRHACCFAVADLISTIEVGTGTRTATESRATTSGVMVTNGDANPASVPGPCAISVPDPTSVPTSVPNGNTNAAPHANVRVNDMDGDGQLTPREAELLWPLVNEAMAGKTFDGKEKVVLAFPRFVRHARCLWPQQGESMRKIALREAKRVNPTYRPHAITALGEFARARPDLDLSVEVIPWLTHVLGELDHDEDAMDVDQHDPGQSHGPDANLDSSSFRASASVAPASASTGDTASTTVTDGLDRAKNVKSTTPTADQLIQAVVECIFAVVDPSTSNADVLDLAAETVRKAHLQVVRAYRSPEIDIAIFTGMCDLVARADRFAKETVTAVTAIGSTDANVSGSVHEAELHGKSLFPSKSLESKAASFLHALVLATVADDLQRDSSDAVGAVGAVDAGPVIGRGSDRATSGTESLRRSRVEMALAVTTSDIPSRATRDVMASVLETWLTSERSRPLRTKIAQAIHHNDRGLQPQAP